MSTTKLTKKQLKAEQFRNKGSKVVSDAKADINETALEIDVEKESREEKAARKERKRAEKARKEQAEASSSAETAEGKEAALKAEKKVKKQKQKEEKIEKAAESGVEKQTTDEANKKSKKRKRNDDTEEKVKKTKKRFTEDGKIEEVEVEQAEPAKEEDNKNEDKRYIIFVGNMSYQSTSDQIAKHFLSHCNETPSVRLLTTKGDPKKLARLSKAKQKSVAKGKAADPSAPTSKGCAFLEFKTASALQKALQFHHTLFDGRTINVELTAGGGGKGDGRKEKIRKKNQDLETERQKLHEKYVKNGKKDKKEEVKPGEAKKELAPAVPHWGPRAGASAQQRGTTKIPKWAASGANAVRLSG